MKSLLFCTSYIRDAQDWTDRYARWVDHYQRHDMGAGQLFLIDDASPGLPAPGLPPCMDAEHGLDQATHRTQVLRFASRLGRASRFSYFGWWRSFTHAVKVARARGAAKLIHVESDAFVLSPRLRSYISSLDSGWTVLWCDFHAMPETAIQVICEDQFDALARFGDGRWQAHDGKPAELVLPFTQVVKDFKGDRYSEMKQHRGLLRSRKFDGLFMRHWDTFWQPIPAEADFVTQVEDPQWRYSRTLRAALAG
jgi:hypothetical protein